MRMSWIAAGVLALGMTAGCTDRQRLQGEWESAEGGQKIEFLRNGDVLWTQPLGTAKGQWEIVENDRVKLSFAGIASLMGPQYCAYAVTGRTLSLTGDCVMAGGYNRVTSPLSGG